jgi:hypothetical protein
MKTAAKWFLFAIVGLIAGILALLVVSMAVMHPASAQTLTDSAPECLPAPFGAIVDPLNPVKGSVMTVGASKNGQWAWWICWRTDGSHQFVRYLGTRALSLGTIGSRMNTVVTSSTPMTAAVTAHKRYALVKATDPTLAAVYADYIASLNQ